MDCVDAQRVETGHDRIGIKQDLVHGSCPFGDAVKLGDKAAIEAEPELGPRAFLGAATDMAHHDARGLDIGLRRNGEGNVLARLGAIKADGALLRPQRSQG